MKTAIKTLRVLVIATVAMAFTSCSKDKTEGNVRVLDLATGDPVPNATVKFYVNSTDANAGFYLCSDGLKQEVYLKTDAAGYTERLCFSLPVVVSLEVSTTGGKSGVGTLNVEEEKSNSVDVKVN